MSRWKRNSSGGQRWGDCREAMHRPAQKRCHRPLTPRARAESRGPSGRSPCARPRVVASRRRQRVVARARLLSESPHSPVIHPLTSSRCNAGYSEALAHLKDVVRRHTQMLRDAISVHRATLQRAQDQQVQCAGQQFGCVVAHSHRLSMESIKPTCRQCQLPSVVDGAGAASRS